MKLRWALLCGISGGNAEGMHVAVDCPADVVLKSTNLPDNVFDPGERQPKGAQKRLKVCKN